MSKTIKSTFATRRDAELAVEHLVQEHGLERTDIFVIPVGEENSAGEMVSEAEVPSAFSGADQRTDGALNGRIEVSIDLHKDDQAPAVRAVLKELGGAEA